MLGQGLGLAATSGGSVPAVAWSSPPQLLDTYSGAIGAYSVRLLRAAYAGDCLEVTRASDSATLDIGFSEGILDTAAIATHCSGTTCTVSKWYDQSGGSMGTLTGTNVSIYESAAVTVDSNGGPMLKMTYADKFELGSATADLSSFLITCVMQLGTHGTNFSGIIDDDDSGDWLAVQPTSESSATQFKLRQDTDESFGPAAGSYYTEGDDMLLAVGADGTDINFRWANSSGASSTDRVTWGETVAVRALSSDFGHTMNGWMEFIVWNSDKQSDRNTIMDNQNTKYSIY
jgi:hypothetical protein